MKSRYALLFAAFSMALSTAVLADNQVSKPAGAMGSGTAAPSQPKSNQFWWPDQLDLAPLRDHDLRSNPAGADFNYAEEFAKLDQEATDRIVHAVFRASFASRVELARQAHAETGIGYFEHKVLKNAWASLLVYEDIIHRKTVGVLGENVFDLAREHVLAARDDHVVGAALDEETPLRVEPARVVKELLT